MSSRYLDDLTTRQRRRGFRAAYANALLWSLGNGMASTTLIFYLASAYGAQVLAISFILATPHFVGSLRLGTGAVLTRVGNRRRFCIARYLASSLLLAALPLMAAPGVLPRRSHSMTALILLWSLFHLFEFVATIALWSWLRDLAPPRIRGRFIGRRERWLLAGRIAGMLTAGFYAYWWREQFPDTTPLFAYQSAAVVGAGSMLWALLPLACIPNLPLREPMTRVHPLKSLWEPLADPRYRRLLVFGCWFSLFNGFTYTAQNTYARDLLGFSVLSLLALQSGMRLGQSGLAPLVGRWADRWGNRPVMIAAQVPVALALLFYALASPAHPWWIAGAWLLWIAYVGLNVGLPNLSFGQQETAATHRCGPGCGMSGKPSSGGQSTSALILDWTPQFR